MGSKNPTRSYSVDNGQKHVRFLLETHPRFPAAGHLPQPRGRPTSALSPWVRAFKGYVGLNKEGKTPPLANPTDRRIDIAYTEFPAGRDVESSARRTGSDGGVTAGDDGDDTTGVRPGDVVLPALAPAAAIKPSSSDERGGHGIGTNPTASQEDTGAAPVTSASDPLKNLDDEIQESCDTDGPTSRPLSMSYRGCDVSAEFPGIFPDWYVPGGGRHRLEQDSSDDEQAVIVLDALTDRSTVADSERMRVSFSPDTALYSYRSGACEAAPSPLYYLDEDQGFVDGDDTPTPSSKGSAMNRMLGKTQKESKEKLEGVSDRRQKFHRGFNYIRGRYPSRLQAKDPAPPRGKNPTFRPPASFCPPSRYAREARVMSAKDRDGKAKKWREPPVYPARPKVKDAAVDCEILRLVETLDMGSQAVAPTADVACQRPLPMVDAAVQYPRTRLRDCSTQASQPETQSIAVQHSTQTRNVMVETCQRLIYHPNNFVITEDKDIQTDLHTPVGEVPGGYTYQQPLEYTLERTPEYTLETAPEYRSVMSANPNPAPSPMKAEEPPYYHPRYENQLRLVLPSDSRSVSMTSAHEDSLDYSSDWDDSESEGVESEAGSISVQVRDDAHE